jgi:hypothetical protein
MLFSSAIITLLMLIVPEPVFSQTLEDNEFIARPTFFAARTGEERCNAIKLWLSSIKFILNRESNEMAGVRIQQIEKASVPASRGIFGKSYSTISKNELKTVVSALKECSVESWVTPLIQSLVNDREMLAGMSQEFENDEDHALRDYLTRLRMKKESDEESQIKAIACRNTSMKNQTPQERIYELGDLLLETDLYQLYGQLGVEGDCWCGGRFSQGVNAVLMYKVDDHYRFENQDVFWKRFDSEMMPAISSRCKSFDRITMTIQIRGYVPLKTGEILEKEEAEKIFKSGSSAGVGYLGFLTYWAKPDGKVERGVSSDQSSIVERRKAKVKAVEDLAAAEIAKQAEAKRQPELRLQAKIAKNLQSHRAQAGEVLKFLKKGALDNYDFSAYNHQLDLKRVYSGDFEPYTGDYESDGQLQLSALGGYVQGVVNRDIRAMSVNSLDPVKIARERDGIYMSYYAYHNVYAQRCRSNMEIPWGENTAYEFYKTANGSRIYGSERRGTVISIRVPFVKRYDAIYGDYGKANVSPERGWIDDFERFLTAEGCASPTVRKFEVNLYLAVNWLLPLQVLQEPEKKEIEPRTPTPKPKTPSTKPRSRVTPRKPAA